MWATVQDVRDALSPRDAHATTAASMPDEYVEAQVEQAEATVRLFLAAYAVPQDGQGLPPQPVRGWVRDIAAYLAHLTWSRNKNVPADDPNRLRYNMAMNTLREVKDGVLTLQFDLVQESGGGGGIAIYNQYEGRLLTSDGSTRAEWGQHALVTRQV